MVGSLNLVPISTVCTTPSMVTDAVVGPSLPLQAKSVNEETKHNTKTNKILNFFINSPLLIKKLVSFIIIL